MNYKLIKSCIQTQIDRIRGLEEIVVVVNCTFEVNRQLLEIPGVALCKSISTEQSLQETVNTAIENARANLALQLKNEPMSSSINTNLTKVMKDMVAIGASHEVKKVTNRGDLDKLYEIAGDDKQLKITGLCEALGIDIIDVKGDSWTNVEALVLINALEKLTAPLVEG